jgi:uncharacterized membrane protein YjfL (UPF0719 family)
MDLPVAYTAPFGAVTSLVLLGLHQVGERVILRRAPLFDDLERANPARGIERAGQVLAIGFVAAGVVGGSLEGESWQADAPWVAAYALAALVLLELTGQAGIRLLVKSKLPAEIERGNVAAGVAAAGHYVATSLIISRCIAGHDFVTLGNSLVFFVLAELTLLAFVTAFRALTTYDDSEEILGENLAAALSYAGITISIGSLLGRAVEGEFLGWLLSLKGFGLSALALLIFYPVRVLVVELLLLGGGFSLRGGTVDKGIRARSVGVATVEAAAYLGTALVLASLG